MPQSRIVGGGNVWTPVTVDTSTDTVFFGTGSATPLYFPSMRPGPNPRTDSLIAVDLKTGQTKWWQQLISGNQWSYDVAQPPLVYDGKVGGQTHHIVSVATDGGRLVRVRREHGQAVLPARQGDRPRRAPVAAAGQARHDLPVVDRRPQLLAGLVRPGDELRLQRGGGDGGAARADAADADAEAQQVRARRRLPRRRRTATSVPSSQGWHDHGSISAIDVEHRPARLEVRDAGARARRRHDDRLRPRLRRRRRRRTARVRHEDRQRSSGRSRRAPRSHPGPTIFAAGGKEYVAITVGGTPTSSNGGTASQLQVFTIGGSPTQSTGTEAADVVPADHRLRHDELDRRLRSRRRPRRPARRRPSRAARRVGRRAHRRRRPASTSRSGRRRRRTRDRHRAA